MTRPNSCPSLKPMAFMTASSPVRSRIACAMVLPDTSRIIRSTAVATRIVIDPTSPTLRAKFETNTFSVAVRVSDDEFANRLSSRSAIVLASAGLATLMTYQLTAWRPNEPGASVSFT